MAANIEDGISRSLHEETTKDEEISVESSIDYSIVYRDLHAGRIDLETAAKRLESALFTKDDSDNGSAEQDLEEDLEGLWQSLIDYACEYPSSQEQLVSLLKILADMPDIAELKNDFPGDRILWRELPCLLGEITDIWQPVWIQEAGEVIFKTQSQFPPHDGARPGKGGPLWDGIPSFCRGRWELWRTRFAYVAALDGVSDSTRACAERASKEMDRIESGR